VPVCCVLCLIVVPLPPGKIPFAVQLNDNIPPLSHTSPWRVLIASAHEQLSFAFTNVAECCAERNRAMQSLVLAFIQHNRRALTVR
jgi:hypothetical protein